MKEEYSSQWRFYIFNSFEKSLCLFQCIVSGRESNNEMKTTNNSKIKQKYHTGGIISKSNKKYHTGGIIPKSKFIIVY
jgi:hypothetical protein